MSGLSNQAANTVNRKNLDLAGQTVLTRTKDLMISLETMIRKIDEDLKFRQDGPGWTSLLDSFSLIAGQVATLIKYLKDERTPELRFTSCYPTHLNPEPDEAVLRLTQGRVPSINHEFVDYFRTRPDPDVESMIKNMRNEAVQGFPNGDSAAAQANKLGVICDRLLDRIYQARENEGAIEKKYQLPIFFDKDDTQSLVSTYTLGTGLTNLVQQAARARPDQLAAMQQQQQQRMPGQQPMMQQMGPAGAPPQPGQPGGQPPGPPMGIKREPMQMAPNPYKR